MGQTGGSTALNTAPHSEIACITWQRAVLTALPTTKARVDGEGEHADHGAALALYIWTSRYLCISLYYFILISHYSHYI